MYFRLALSLLAISIVSQRSINAAQPSISNFTLIPRFMVTSEVGATDQIQYCSDLAQNNWMVLTNLVPDRSPYWFIDVTAAPASPQRFYRVVSGVTTQSPFSQSNSLAVVIVGDSQTAGDYRTPPADTWEDYLRTLLWTNQPIALWTNKSVGGGVCVSHGLWSGTVCWASTNYDTLIHPFTPAQIEDVNHTNFYVLMLPIGINDPHYGYPVTLALHAYSNICHRARLDKIDYIVAFTTEEGLYLTPTERAALSDFNRIIMGKYPTYDVLIPWHAYFDDPANQALPDGIHWKQSTHIRAAVLADSMIRSGVAPPPPLIRSNRPSKTNLSSS
jgi:hypothetical protein